jgi:hypothetical protein
MLPSVCGSQVSDGCRPGSLGGANTLEGEVDSGRTDPNKGGGSGGVEVSRPKPPPERTPVGSGDTVTDTAGVVVAAAAPGAATLDTRRSDKGDCCAAVWYERKAAGPDAVRVARRRSSKAMVVGAPTLMLAARRP